MTKHRIQWLSGTAVLALLVTAAPVRAQQVADQAQAKKAGLEEIVVTAEKRKEDNQTVPVAVTAFSTAAIENTNQRDISDLSAMVPNLEIGSSGSGPNSSIVSLRGLSFQDIEKSFEPPIGVVMDGVFLSTSTGQIAQVFDFDSIEVAAGPQGTLFGKNTTGGVINITRSKPDPDATEDVSGKVRLTVGNFGEHDGEAVLDAVLDPHVLALKLAVFSQNNDGAFADPVIGHNIGARDYQSFSLGLDWHPNSKGDVYVVFDRTLDHSQLSPQISAATPDALPLSIGGFVDGHDTPCLNPFLPNLCVNGNGSAPSNVATSNEINDGAYNLYAVTLNASYDFDSFKLYSITGARFSVEDSYNDYDASQYTLFETHRPESYRQESEELRYESEYKGPFNFVAGAYYFYSNYTLQQYSFLDFAAVVPSLPPGIAGDWFGQYTQQSSKNEALFIQGTYNITEDLRVIGGARQSWDQKSIAFSLYGDPTGSLSTFKTEVPGSAANESHSWAQFTPKFGIEYQIDPNAMTYFSYTKGYNAGGFNGRAGSAEVLGPYAPEQVHSFEVGAKTTWFDNRLRINGDLFQADFNHAQLDEIVAIPVAPFTGTAVTNAADITYQGAELEVQAKPIPNWLISANVGLLNAKYTSFEAALLLAPGSTVPVPTNNTGLTVRRTPPVTFGFDTDYTIPAGPGELGFNTAVKYVGAQQFDLLNDPRGHQDTVTKLDAAIRYNVDINGVDWTLTLFGKNLTNQTPNNAYVTGYQGSFVEFWNQEVGRTYGATLQANF